MALPVTWTCCTRNAVATPVTLPVTTSHRDVVQDVMREKRSSAGGVTGDGLGLSALSGDYTGDAVAITGDAWTTRIGGVTGDAVVRTRNVTGDGLGMAVKGLTHDLPVHHRYNLYR